MPTRSEVAKYLKLWFTKKGSGVWNDPIGKVIKTNLIASENWKGAPKGDRGANRAIAWRKQRAAEKAERERLKSLESTTYIESKPAENLEKPIDNPNKPIDS